MAIKIVFRCDMSLICLKEGPYCVHVIIIQHLGILELERRWEESVRGLCGLG